MKEKRMAEVPKPLNPDELLLQPWFLPDRVSHAVRSLFPNHYIKRMRDYFDDYGCMRCGDREALYKANGMCRRCHQLVRERLARSAMRRMNPKQTSAYARKLLEKGLQARELLRDLRDGAPAPETGPGIDTAHATNPVLEVFNDFKRE